MRVYAQMNSVLVIEGALRQPLADNAHFDN